MFILGVNIENQMKTEASAGGIGGIERRRSPRTGQDTATHCHQRCFNIADLKPQPPLPFLSMAHKAITCK